MTRVRLRAGVCREVTTAMSEGTVPSGRRWFLRSATGAALAVVATGAQALFGASAASAQESTCCRLAAKPDPWCPFWCAQQNHNLRCWTCNDGRCMCCECTPGDSCWTHVSVCSRQTGCCS